MKRRNRDWKSFNKRWGRSRFEKFVMWSAALHLVLAALFVMPARSARQHKAELQIRQQTELKRKEQQRQEAQQVAELEFRELAKIELAKEQLRDLFGELTEEFFDEDISELMWDELLEWFDPDLEELVDLLELEEFDQVAFEQEIDGLRERLVDRLAELLLEKQQELVARQLQQEARDAAGQMVDSLQQQLRARVADPMTTSIRRLVTTEYATVERLLLAADTQLAAAADAAETAEARLEGVAEQLSEQQRAFAQAQTDGDNIGKVKATARIKSQAGTAIQAAGQLKRAVVGLTRTADQLASRFPAIAEQISGVQRQAEAGRQQAEAASEAAVKTEAAGAEDNTQAARAAAVATGKSARSLRNAVQKQLAAERATRLARMVNEQVQAANEIAQRQGRSEADGQPDGAQTQKSDAAVKSAVGQIGQLEADTAQLQAQIAQLVMTAPARREQPSDSAPQVASTGEANPGSADAPRSKTKAETKTSSGTVANAERKPDSDTSPTSTPAARRESPEVDSDDPLTQAEQATADAGEALKGAREALAGHQSGRAAEQLKTARSKLVNVARTMLTLQQEDGPPSQSFGEQLETQLSAMRRNSLARQAREKFDDAFQNQSLPVILDKVAKAAAKRANAERAFTDAFDQQLRNEMGQLFGKDVPLEVAAGKQVAGMPELEAGDPDAANDGSTEKPSARVAEVVNQIESQTTALIYRTVPGIAASAVRHLELNSIGKTSLNSDRRSMTLMTRLQNLRGQLSAGRRDALGSADSTAVAATLRRHRGRKGSLLRLGGLGDLDGKAFREMVEAMKARGQQSGSEFALVATTGEKSVANQAPAFNPALIAVPAEVGEVAREAADSEARKVEPPEFQTNRFAGIPLLEVDAITIDGDVSDWQDVTTLELDPVQRGARLPKVTPKHQTAWAAHSSRGLLIAFNVADTNGQLDNTKPRPAFWMSDCVEIYIDTMNTKYSARGETNTHQFFAFPFGHPSEPDVAAYEAQARTENGKLKWKHVPFKQDVIQRAGQKTEQGWSIELLIPRTVLRKGSLKPGRIIGMNLQVDTGTDLYYFWTCAKQIISSQHPNTWGDVQFLGSDGRIELLDPEDTQTDSLFPGQPLRVRVVDPDMNLSELRRDKIGVTARTASGDTEPLILEETQAGSGVFEGALQTTLSIGSSQHDRLELFEGETVSVQYIDQARAFGERNVPIKQKVTVNSIGVEFVKRSSSLGP